MQAGRYQDLRAWQLAITFVEHVYAFTSKLPREEIFGLRSQMRRSAVSVPSSIAEGQGRASRGEFLQFLEHARGSLYEIETQIVIAARLDYMVAGDSDVLLAEARELGRVLNGLIGSLKSASVGSAARRFTTDNRQLTTDN